MVLIEWSVTLIFNSMCLVSFTLPSKPLRMLNSGNVYGDRQSDRWAFLASGQRRTHPLSPLQDQCPHSRELLQPDSLKIYTHPDTC